MAVSSARIFAILLLIFCGVAPFTFAVSSGIDGFSGNPLTTGGANCNACHAGGVVPIVNLSGPVDVEPNASNVYSLSIRGGQQIAGGLDVSATAGALFAFAPDTQIIGGELAHLEPKPTDLTGRVTWTFVWQAPASPGQVTLYGAGNSVNLGQGANGDAAGLTSLTIDVAGVTQGPGEASAEGLDPLLVTGRSPIDGSLDLSFAPPCGATDNHIYYGPLDLVAAHGWNGEVCGIGTTGTHSGFDPGAGSFFFIVVGNDAAIEGSYGHARPPFDANLCGATQDLSNSCDGG
jgi:hypothetical protein